MNILFSFLTALMLSGAVTSADADGKYIPSEENIRAREAFEDNRFGVFIHWGIYSMFAQGEWYMNKGIDAQEYAKAHSIIFKECVFL